MNMSNEELKARFDESWENLIKYFDPDYEITDTNATVELLPEEVIKGNHVRFTIDIYLQKKTATDNPSSGA